VTIAEKSCDLSAASPRKSLALLDRFLHHCHVMNISGDSFRLKEKAGKPKGKPTA
jgi:DNA replication protein DnaC